MKDMKRPYKKPEIEVIEVDNDISLLMVSFPDPPPVAPPNEPGKSDPDDDEPHPIWG